MKVRWHEDLTVSLRLDREELKVVLEASPRRLDALDGLSCPETA